MYGSLGADVAVRDPKKLAASFCAAFLRVDDPRTNTSPLLLRAERDAARMTGGAKDTLIRRNDLLPAYLFGPGHGSLTYGLEIDGAVGRSHGFQEQVITNEIIRRDMSKRERERERKL